MFTMEGSTLINEQPAEKIEQGGLPGSARKVRLFTFGVVATAIEEGYDLFSRLMEHREAAEQEGRKRLQELMDKRKAEVRKAEDEVANRVQNAKNLDAFPSKADIAALDEKIAMLSDQIDAILNS